MVFLVKPFKVAGAAITSTYFKMLLIPIAALAIGNAVHTFWKMFSEEPSILAARDQLSWLYQYFAVELPNAFKRLWTSFKNVMSYNWSIIEKFVGYLRSEAAQTAIQAIMMLINPLSGAAVKPAIKGFIDLYDGIIAGVNKAKGPLDELRASFNHLLQMLKHDSQDAAKATSDFWATFSKLYGEGLVDKFKAVQKAIGWEAFKKWFADLADAGEMTLLKVNALIKGLGTSVEDASEAMEDSIIKAYEKSMSSLENQLWSTTQALDALKSGLIIKDQFEAYKKYLNAVWKAAETSIEMTDKHGEAYLRLWMKVEKVNEATKAYFKTLKEVGEVEKLLGSISGKEAYLGILQETGNVGAAEEARDAIKASLETFTALEKAAGMEENLGYIYWQAYLKAKDLDGGILKITDSLNNQIKAGKLADTLIQKVFDLQATGAEKAVDALRAQVLEWRAVAAAIDNEDMRKALEDLINLYEKLMKDKAAKKWFDDLVDLAKSSAQNMQQSMSDFFFDYMRDELKTAEDYWDAFYNNLLRLATNYAAKMAMMGLFGVGIEKSGGLVGATASATGSWLWGGIKSIVGNLFGGANDPMGFGGPATAFAQGGWITEPVFGIGRSGAAYTFAENRPEFVGQSGGGGDVNVIINNYSDEKTKVSKQRNAQGGKDILVMIGEAAAGSIRTSGPLAKQMKTTYGLNPIVGGR
jgi:hypothetical protein